MRKILRYLLDCVLRNFRSRAALQLELIVLRHQLEALQRTRTARVRLTRLVSLPIIISGHRHDGVHRVWTSM